MNAPYTGECAACHKRVRLVGWSGDRPIYGHLTNPTYLHHAVRLARRAPDALPDPAAMDRQVSSEGPADRASSVAVVRRDAGPSNPDLTANATRGKPKGRTRTAFPSESTSSNSPSEPMRAAVPSRPERRSPDRAPRASAPMGVGPTVAGRG